LTDAVAAHDNVSLDGERDSPAVLKEYLSQFSERFIGLAGKLADVKPIAAQFSAAFFRGSVQDGAYTVSYSPQVFVVDQAGQLRAEFYNASVEAMIGVTQALLEEANHTGGESRQGR